MTTAEIKCCGQWTNYPSPGRDTQCAVCGTTFTVPDQDALLRLSAQLERITLTAELAAQIWTGPDDGDRLRARLAEVARLADAAGALLPSGNVTGT